MKLRMTKPKEKAKSKSLLSDQTKKKKVSLKNKKVSDKSKDKKQTKEAAKQTKSKKNQSKQQRQNKFFQDPYKTEIQNQEQSKKCSQTQKSIPYPPTPNVSRQALFGTMSKINNQILAKLSGLIINLRSLMIMTQAEIINAITYAKGMSPSISDYFEMQYTNRMSYIASLFKQNGRKYQKYQKMAQQQVNRVLNIYKQEWKENKFIYEIQTNLINDFRNLTLT